MRSGYVEIHFELFHAQTIAGSSLTLIYVDVPTKVLAIELISSPDTPKSQSLICPLELRRIFEGLISIRLGFKADNLLGAWRQTSMDYPMRIIQISKTLENTEADFTNDLNRNGSVSFVNTIKATFVHELHAYANVRLRDKSAVERYDVRRVAIVHDL